MFFTEMVMINANVAATSEKACTRHVHYLPEVVFFRCVVRSMLWRILTLQKNSKINEIAFTEAVSNKATVTNVYSLT